MNIQFGGYEGGNVLAAISGAGGFGAFSYSVSSVLGDEAVPLSQRFLELTSNYPDVTVTLGLGATVLGTPILRRISEKVGGNLAVNATDIASMSVASGVLLYALTNDASMVTVSGTAFVVGSSFLQQSKNNPVLIKAAGLMWVFGGAALSMFGVEGMNDPELNRTMIETAMHGLTTITGASVVAASTLMYQGGGYELDKYLQANPDRERSGTLASRILDPEDGILTKTFERVLDGPIAFFNEKVVNPAIFWVPPEMKQGKPFMTSMWTRAPFRVATGGAALVAAALPSLGLASEGAEAAYYAFAAANACWLMGDVAVGSIDWSEEVSDSSVIKIDHE